MLGNAEQSLSLATNCLASRSGTLSALALRTTGSNSEAAATGLSVPDSATASMPPVLGSWTGASKEKPGAGAPRLQSDGVNGWLASRRCKIAQPRDQPCVMADTLPMER
jgi:hypothetical protein